MTPAPNAPSSRSGRFLVGVLIVLGLVYVALLPTLRRMQDEARRLDRLTEERQAEMARLAGARSALDAARSAVAHAPGDAQAHLALARQCGDVGQLDEALREAAQAAALLPRDPEPQLLLADLHRRRRDYERTVAAYRAALALKPDDARALTGLALLYISFGWPIEAERLLQPAVQAAPENAQLKVTLAMASVQHEDYAAAERLLLDTRRIAPREPALWSPLVRVYYQTRQYPKAIAVAQDVLALQPDDASVRNELGKALFQSNDLARAVAVFQDNLSRNANDLTARYYLGLCLQRMNRPAEAAQALEAVLKAAPDYEQTRLLLGNLYTQQGRTVEGKRLLDQAREAKARSQEMARINLLVATHPDSADAHYQMALVYRRQGNEPRMRLELSRALELDPQHAGARRLRDGVAP